MAPAKAARKAAKKLAGDHGRKRGDRDMLRAFEHLGRVSVLEKLLSGPSTGQIGVLIELAKRSLLQGERKSAADMLRAGEHWGFGSLASPTGADRLGDGLAPAVNAEYEHLVDKAQHHRQKHEAHFSIAILAVYESMLESANVAFQEGAYRRALEFARGAEALAHVRGGTA